MSIIFDKIKKVHYLAARKEYTIGFYTGGVKLSE